MLFVKPDGEEAVEIVTNRKRPRPKRDADSQRELLDYTMLLLSNAGLSPTDVSEVAKAFAAGAKSREKISMRIKEARERTQEGRLEGNACGLYEPELTPRYGVRSFVPSTTCNDIHPYGDIPNGARDYCESCANTGVEGLPVFQPNARDRNGRAVCPDRTRRDYDGTQEGLLGGKA